MKFLIKFGCGEIMVDLVFKPLKESEFIKDSTIKNLRNIVYDTCRKNYVSIDDIKELNDIQD